MSNTGRVGGKGRRKNVENYIKNGGKGLKNSSFLVINSKNVRGGKNISN